MNRFLLVLLVFTLAGCQSAPSVKAPLSGKSDWYQAGFADALAGAVEKDIRTLAADFNDLKPDYAAYHQGYVSGQQKICHTDVLHAWGQKGQIFPASCDSVENARLLREAWQKGMDKGARDALTDN